MCPCSRVDVPHLAAWGCPCPFPIRTFSVRSYLLPWLPGVRSFVFLFLWELGFAGGSHQGRSFTQGVSSLKELWVLQHRSLSHKA